MFKSTQKPDFIWLFLFCFLWWNTKFFAQDFSLVELVDQFLKATSTEEKTILKQILKKSPDYQKIQKTLLKVFYYLPKQTGSYRYTFPISSKKKLAEYYVLVPKNYDPKQKYSLILDIHGTDGSGEKTAKRLLPLILTQNLPYFFVCPSSEQSGVGWKFTEEERQIQLQAVRKTIQEFSIDTNQIYVMGGSRGGHGTWELGLFYTDYFAALFSIVGGPRITSLRFLENLKDLPLKDVQGALDDPLLVENLRIAVQKLKKLKYPIFYKEYPNQGHGVPWNIQESIDFFQKKRRNPHPSEVLCFTDQLEHGERFWIKLLKLGRKSKKPKQIVIPGFQKMDPSSRRKAYIKAIEKYRASVIATISKNNILKINYKNVKKLEIRIDPTLVNPTKPIKIECNGKKKWEGIVKWDPAFCLREYKRLKDIERLYWGKVELKLK